MKNIYRLLPLLVIGLILSLSSVVMAQKKCRDKKNRIIPCPKQTTKTSAEDKWENFNGDGFSVMFPGKVEIIQMPLGIKVYGAAEGLTKFRVGVAPNGAIQVYSPGIDSAKANAMFWLNNKVPENTFCESLWKAGFKCRLELSKSYQIQDMYTLEYYIYIDEKGLGYYRSLHTAYRVYDIHTVNLKDFENKIFDKFFNSFKVITK